MDLSESELNEVLNIFKSEGLEILDIMDSKLLLLERDLENKELVLELFREAHSVKGSARMLGFNSIQNLVHKIEDIFGYYRDLKIKPTPENIEVITKTLNYVKFLIEKTVENKAEFYDESYEYYINSLNEVIETKEEFKSVEIVENSTTQTYEENPYLKIENYLYELILNYTLVKKFSDLAYLKAILVAIYALEGVANGINIDGFVFKVQDIKNCVNEIEEKNFVNINDANDLLLALDTKISEIITQYTDHCLNNKIQAMDFYEKVFEQVENIEKEKKQKHPKVSDEISELIKNIQNLQENPSLINTIENSLKKIIIALSAHKDNLFFRSLYETFEIYKKHGKIIERDTYIGICDILSEYLSSPSKKRNEELELFIQRAEIIHSIAQINIKSENKKTCSETNKFFYFLLY